MTESNLISTIDSIIGQGVIFLGRVILFIRIVVALYEIHRAYKYYTKTTTYYKTIYIFDADNKRINNLDNANQVLLSEAVRGRFLTVQAKYILMV